MSSGQDFNPGPQEYGAELLTITTKSGSALMTIKGGVLGGMLTVQSYLFYVSSHSLILNSQKTDIYRQLLYKNMDIINDFK